MATEKLGVGRGRDAEGCLCCLWNIEGRLLMGEVQDYKRSNPSIVGGRRQGIEPRSMNDWVCTRMALKVSVSFGTFVTMMPLKRKSPTH